MQSILVVDDTPAVRWAISESLVEAGYHVAAIDSGAEALISLQQQSFDLLLVDYLMASMKGDEVAQHARQAAPDLKVIFLTAYSEFLSLTGKLASEVVIEKPVSLTNLLERVEAVLSNENNLIGAAA